MKMFLLFCDSYPKLDRELEFFDRGIEEVTLTQYSKLQFNLNIAVSIHEFTHEFGLRVDQKLWNAN